MGGLAYPTRPYNEAIASIIYMPTFAASIQRGTLRSAPEPMKRPYRNNMKEYINDKATYYVGKGM